ncbi:hypothetical protein GDO86_006407 [Hymenochirus boettgeri]|uniref:WD repeat-containing protein 93 n=1 Tax=Hymenochirus boettgeri TaxID=247094 RepID=A0A8T2JAQ2_9PIPI|nr:hypothetical protein GDO86_006407 [Hymenochirus boettgeri]KAG8440644.1 hypothetical protein GDO86_006407 [Hymenochirus boettgeri]KAG8440645.1 hypothetical protein GDO86_006407 [Hymenochirus boettgeri]KAG8440646.1 hypothetical protein GDO86_006407 [Hymenochirus boettgeri]KAG8440647.1 hypothetical protein GDO86_006407 [Hymenochirus boettgeri]
MPVYIKKGPLEIPPGSERDWVGQDEQDDWFIKDPDQALDILPQPSRMIEKVVNILITGIGKINIKEQKREAEKLKKKIDVHQPLAEIQVAKRINCMAAGGPEEYIFVGHSEGLSVYSFPDCNLFCSWDSPKVEICSLNICYVKNRLYLLSTVDDMGIARLFYFYEDKLNVLKVINEPTSFLPTEVELKLTAPMLLIKIKPPKPITGSTFKSAQEALQACEQNNVFGTGQNHIISARQLEQQEAIFTSLFQKYPSDQSARTPEIKITRHANFHFVQPDKILPVEGERNQTAIPKAVSVHWQGCHNLLFYLLVPTPKDKTDVDMKPDIVWPCAAAITYSTLSTCSTYLTVGFEDGSFSVWDIHFSGFPLAVIGIPEGRSISSLQFLDHTSFNENDLSQNSTQTASKVRIKILVRCTDNSLYLVTASGGKETNLTILQQSPDNSDGQISTVVPVSNFPNAVLLFFCSGLIQLMDITTQEPVCQFELPFSHQLAYPWQPAYALDQERCYLFLNGEEKSTVSDISAVKKHAFSLFAFSLNCMSLKEAFPKTQQLAVPPTEMLEWDQKCQILFQKRLQNYSERSKHIAESWAILRKQASTLM